MKRTNRKDYREKVDAYLIGSLYDFEGSREEAVRRLWERFDVEANHESQKRHTPNTQERVAYWLSGLPLNVAYTHEDIVATAEDWHECQLTDAQAERVVNLWFPHLACHLIRLWVEHGINPHS